MSVSIPVSETVLFLVSVITMSTLNELPNKCTTSCWKYFEILKQVVRSFFLEIYEKGSLGRPCTALG